MTTPLLRNRRHPGIPVLSRLGREMQTSPVWLSDGVNYATTTFPALTVTAGGSAHTKGSWVEIVASLSEDVGCIAMNTTAVVAIASSDSRVAIDIGIGGAGSETVIVANVAVGAKSSSSSGWLFPVFIPKGTRVAFRSQHVVASTANTFRFRFGAVNPGAAKPAPYTVSIGAVTATSSATSVPTGGAAAKGAWTELTSATTERLSGFQICADLDGDASSGSGTALVDIGIGASGSETVIAGDFFYVFTNNEAIDHFGGGSPIVLVDIPAGVRVAARLQQTSGSNTAFGVMIVGFPARGR